MSSSDSEDEVPLSKRFKKSAAPPSNTANPDAVATAAPVKQGGPAAAPSAPTAEKTALPKPLPPGKEAANGQASSGASQPSAKASQPQANRSATAGFSRHKLSGGLGSGTSASESETPTANGTVAANGQRSAQQKVQADPQPKAGGANSHAAKPSGSGGSAPRPGAPGTTASGDRAPQHSSGAQKAVAGAPRPGPSKLSAAPKPGSSRPQPASLANGAVKKAAIDSDSDSDDNVPLGQRFKQPGPSDSPAVKPAPKPQKRSARAAADREPAAKPKRRAAAAASDERTPKRRKAERGGKEEGKEKKWDTLAHCGVLFPPEYAPHGVKMLYDGRPVELTPAQEEVASMYAIMVQTDYIKKEKFKDNFWAAFRQILGKGHAIKSLDKCDFTPIYEHLMAERDAKKALSKEEKLRLKEEKEAAEAKYKVASVDGKKEKVGNFRVEPPGLFRGRGDHPKMGMVKRRIYPRDITINIGRGEPVPEHPYPGQKWKEVRHDQNVTWLAFWKDSISDKDYKYVWLGADSAFKSTSDLAKYEKARKLKDYVDDIREMYTKDWASSVRSRQQMAAALYFIDKLALRAGHEKDEDEADTVGCCTLKVENVECLEDNHKLKFDFLGKDSIRYENTVEVDERVWKMVKKFCKQDGKGKAKQPGDQLFEEINATDLNDRLKELMEGLSVKVFRTYNASITLDRLLWEEKPLSKTVEEKKADYDLANKEVAILCNHQRAVPKGHDDQMQRLTDKVMTAQAEYDELTLELLVVEGKAKASKLKDPSKRLPTEDVLKNRMQRKREQLQKLQVQSRSKNDLKTVALGTSKINYLDPRITIAWCKREEVPLEKIFNKSLLTKFHWAMDAHPDFKF